MIEQLLLKNMQGEQSQALYSLLKLTPIVCFIIAGVALLIAVLLFIKFRHPRVGGDLSDKTARKSVNQMRESNEKSQGSSPVNQNRGKLTATMEQSEEKPKTDTKEQKKEQTGVLQENRPQKIAAQEAVLRENKPKRPVYEYNATEPLKETTLPGGKEPVEKPGFVPKKELSALDDIMLIHTAEIIE